MKKKKEKYYDAATSKIKMLIYLKNGKSETFYSFFAEENKPTNQIIARMRKRLLQGTFKNSYTCALFYNNQTGNEITRFDYYGHKVQPQKQAV